MIGINWEQMNLSRWKWFEMRKQYGKRNKTIAGRI